ncbi:MAG: DsbA family protein, partial [Paracoccaceae bacterium]|nr:DsbA family protein [Paracoccaceae bacterium]
MQRRTVVSGLALMAAAAGAGLWLTRAPEAPLPFAAEAQATGEVDKSRVMEMTLGSPDAKVEVVEYASFTCPHCRNFHQNVFGQIKANYIDIGKIRFVYREVYFDRFGLWAGMVARCGGGQRYFGIAEL